MLNYNLKPLVSSKLITLEPQVKTSPGTIVLSASFLLSPHCLPQTKKQTACSVGKRVAADMHHISPLCDKQCWPIELSHTTATTDLPPRFQLWTQTNNTRNSDTASAVQDLYPTKKQKFIQLTNVLSRSVNNLLRYGCIPVHRLHWLLPVSESDAGFTGGISNDGQWNGSAFFRFTSTFVPSIFTSLLSGFITWNNVPNMMCINRKIHNFYEWQPPTISIFKCSSLSPASSSSCNSIWFLLLLLKKEILYRFI